MLILIVSIVESIVLFLTGKRVLRVLYPKENQTGLLSNGFKIRKVQDEQTSMCLHVYVRPLIPFQVFYEGILTTGSFLSLRLCYTIQ